MIAQNTSSNTANGNTTGKKGTKGKGGKQGGGTPKKNGTKPAPSPSNTPAPSAPNTGDQSAPDTKSQGQQGNKSDSGTPPGAPNVCRAISVGPVGSAADFKSQLNQVGGVTINVAGDRKLVACGPPANVDLLESVIQELSAYPGAGHPHQTHVVRLFYARQADKIADAINKSGGLSTPVKFLGNDVLVFPSESESDDVAIRELKRWIALIDVPRPEVSLSAWSIQISSKDLNTILKESENIRQFVGIYNERLHSALQQGWRYLEKKRSPASKQGLSPCDTASDFFASTFCKYLTNRFVWQEIDKYNPGSAAKLFLGATEQHPDMPRPPGQNALMMNTVWDMLGSFLQFSLLSPTC